MKSTGSPALQHCKPKKKPSKIAYDTAFDVAEITYSTDGVSEAIEEIAKRIQEAIDNDAVYFKKVKSREDYYF